jgi:hypothetical protein
MPGWSRLANTAERWRKLRQLKPGQWTVLLASLLMLPLTSFRLRSRGYRQTLQWVSPPVASTSGLAPADEAVVAKDTAFAVGVAAKYGIWRPRCLSRSLALGWFLRRRGIPFDIRIGVPDKAGVRGGGAPDFSAHAWVEHRGVVLNDRENIEEEFRTFKAGEGPV